MTFGVVRRFTVGYASIGRHQQFVLVEMELLYYGSH